MRFMLGLLTLVGVGVSTLVIAFWLGQRQLMYLPSGGVGTPEQAGLTTAEAVRLRTADGLDLGAWFVPAAAGVTRATAIVFNGNAGNRTYRVTLATRLSHAGFAVLLLDYRGYGDNPGAPTEDGLATDARAAREYLLSRSDVDPRRLVYFGESLGGAVAIGLAVEHPPAVLVLRSPFSSMADVAAFHYPWLPVRWIIKDRYPSLDRITRVTSPVFLIAGDEDRIVPASQTRALYDAARAPKDLLMLSGADHNDEALAEGPVMIERMAAFVDGVLSERGSR